MSNSITLINEILVQLFNDILTVEEKALKSGNYKDLSITEFHTLEAISNERPKSMSEIADKLKITVGTLTTAINKLLRKGYVERKRNDNDRRIVLIKLTEKGINANKQHERFHTLMVEKMISELKIEEDKILLKSLENLKKFFESKYTNDDK